MAIKKELTGYALGSELQRTQVPNAMVFQIVRTGTTWYFDGDRATLLVTEPVSILDTRQRIIAGTSIMDFQERNELREILIMQGDRFMLETITETVRVVARFFV